MTGSERVSLAGDLDALRRAADLSYRDLARLTGCPRSTLNDALSGRRFPRLDTVLVIVRVCGGDEDRWRARWAHAERSRSGLAPDAATESVQRVPAELPHATSGFTGRAVELARLDALLAAGDARDPDAVFIVSIDGTAGVGKTALAVRWAHQITNRFPGGQLFLNLRGHHPRESPVRPERALEQLLRALGVPPEHVPADPDERARRYRSALAGRHVLVLLDDAATAEQVRPLLPGDPSCAAIVTSRVRMDGLTVCDGAHRLGLDVLATDEARDMLTRVLGSERVHAEPDAAAELAALCAHLPLAMRIAAAHLIDHPGRRIGDLVRELAADDRLGALQIPNDDTSVRAAFELSYRRLAALARRLFRRFGLMPGADFTVEAAAALGAADVAQAAQALEILASAHMVEQHSAGRYHLHDLLRCYAGELANDEDSEQDRAAALGRLLDWYLDRADRAARVLTPHLARLANRATAPVAVDGLFVDEVSALAWLEAERDNLVAAIRHAADHGPRPIAWQLADTLRGFFQLRLHSDSWRMSAAAGLLAASKEGDAAAQGAMQHNFGILHWRTGSLTAAIDCLTRALRSYQEVEWVEGCAAILHCLSAVYWQLGRLHDAVDVITCGIALCKRHGLVAREAVCHSNLAMTYHALGRLLPALEQAEQGLAMHQQQCNNRAVALDLTWIGDISHDLAKTDRAMSCYDQARALFATLESRDGQAHALRGIASVLSDLGRHEQALTTAEEGFTLAAGTTNDPVLVDVRNTLGSAYGRVGLRTDAIYHLEETLRHAQRGRYLRGEINALVNLAAVHVDHDDRGTGMQCCQRALALTGRGYYPLLRAKAFGVLAEIQLMAGNPDKAMAYCQRSVALNHECGCRQGEMQELARLNRLRL